MRILVTGGCGFIGSHVVDALVNGGHDVAIVDNLSSGKLENKNERARFYHADICGPEVDAIIGEERPEIIDHHAAQISVPQSVSDPLEDAEVNIKGTLKLLESSRLLRRGLPRDRSRRHPLLRPPQPPRSKRCCPRA